MGNPGLVHNAYIADGASVTYIAADKRELRDGFRWVVQRVGGRREYVTGRRAGAHAGGRLAGVDHYHDIIKPQDECRDT